MPNEKGETGRDLAQLGALFGTSGRWIGELRSRGQMPADGAPLVENIAAWTRYQVGKASNV